MKIIHILFLLFIITITLPLIEAGRVGDTVAENDNVKNIYNQIGQIGIPLFILSLAGIVFFIFEFTKDIKDEKNRRLLRIACIWMFAVIIFA